jgi:hypothetical protein
MSQRLAHDDEALTSRVALLVPDAVAPQWEQGLHRLGMPQGLLEEVRTEKAPWEEFCAHGASLNAALTEALRFHGGRSLQIFQVRIFV